MTEAADEGQRRAAHLGSMESSLCVRRSGTCPLCLWTEKDTALRLNDTHEEERRKMWQ